MALRQQGVSGVGNKKLLPLPCPKFTFQPKRTLIDPHSTIELLRPVSST